MKLCLVRHLSNFDGMEPHASQLRAKFTQKDLAEKELDRLVKQFSSIAVFRGIYSSRGTIFLPYKFLKVRLFLPKLNFL